MNIFKEAILIHGEQAQLEMVIEECAELIKAIQKFKRKHRSTVSFIGKDGTKYPFFTAKDYKSFTSIIEEATDVELMLAQLPYIFPDSNAWKVTRRDKIKRLTKKLKKARKRQIDSTIKKLETG